MRRNAKANILPRPISTLSLGGQDTCNNENQVQENLGICTREYLVSSIRDQIRRIGLIPETFFSLKSLANTAAFPFRIRVASSDDMASKWEE